MSAARPPRATMTTVARALGVSPSTVSNAYNRPDQLSADLRARVLATAARLGYGGPDPVARTLRHGRTGALGLVYDEPLSFAFADPAAVACLRGVAAVCERHAVGLTLVPRLEEGPDLVGTALVDGFVVYCLAEGDPRVQAAQARGLPLVTIDSPRDTGGPVVTVDDRGGARAAAEHLLALGHRRVAVVSTRLGTDGVEGTAPLARQDALPYDGCRERLAGYRDAWEAAGLDWAAVRVEERIPYSRDAGRRAAHDLLAADPPTAVIAMSDELALGTLDAAAALGLRVPADLSVVGSDDTPSAAAAGLTTVAQPHAGKGTAAARLLLEPGGVAPSAPLPTHLVVRTSTAAPRAVGR